MAKITPIAFPGRIGIADELNMKTFFDLEGNVARINYQFVESSTRKVVSYNTIIVPQDVYSNWGTDNQYIIDWVASELGVELVKQD